MFTATNSTDFKNALRSFLSAPIAPAETADGDFTREVQSLIDNKTKPLGALGELERLALRIARIQGAKYPRLSAPQIIVFAADHGIAREENVSLYPQEVTAQMVRNFARGGAGINVFARQHGIALTVVDAGVASDLSDEASLIHAKIARGTRSFLREAAMSREECLLALRRGAEITGETLARASANVVGFGEMGIGNTSAAAAIMRVVTGEPLENCVGAGTGLDEAGKRVKTDILRRALERRFQRSLPPDDASPLSISPLETLAEFGGFEIAMICGGILEAAARRAVVVVDGFIVGAAALIAAQLEPLALDYCIFSHCSAERGHAAMLRFLGAKPLLSLDLRLGEGTGAALAYPLLQSATLFLKEMATFQSAGVSESKEKQK
jgi:nicotinate-nucleotide--dimethylbenzimidazole phosphoribosyltransferase